MVKIVYNDEWDPWKRHQRKQERRMWDPWARMEYERDRMQWDPWFRYWKEQERLQWDPYFMLEKEIERKHWDPEYRQKLYEERQMNSQRLETYYENPMDLILRQRHESMYSIDIYKRKSRRDEYQEKKQREMTKHNFTRRGGNQQTASTVLGEQDRERTVLSTLPTSGGGSGSYTSYIFRIDEELPSLAAVLAEGIIPPAIVGFFTLVTGLCWGSASPFALTLLFMFASIFLGAAEAKRATAMLLIYSVPLLLLEPWSFGDPQTVRMMRFDALLKATIILSIIGAIYVLYWWKRIREEG